MLAVVLEHLPGTTCFHASTHGAHHPLAPSQSGLKLADSVLRLELLRDARLAAARLVFLSACESGLAEVRKLPEEFIGLLSGFVQAGAACVIGSLWPIGDTAAFLLATRFYDVLLDAKGQERTTPAAALREAQDWLRRVSFAQLRQMFAIDSSGHYLVLNSATRMVPIDELPVHLRLGADHEQPFDTPDHWAAFIATGV